MNERRLKPGWKVWRFDQMALNVNDRIDIPSEAGLDYYVGLEHLDSESLRIRRWGKPSDVNATKLLFKTGDIIFGRRRAYQRKLGIAEFDGVCSAHAIVLRARPEVVLPEFLPFFMQSDLFMNRAIEISVGSLSPTINWTTLAQQEFALPPLEEQRRIAEVLRAVEEVVISWNETSVRLETLIATVREYILCDENLPRAKLKTCVHSITAGKSVLGIGRPANDHEFGVLKVSAVGSEGFVVSENKVLINADDFIPGLSVHPHDLLITRANTRELVGRVCIVPRSYSNLMLSDKTLRLEVREIIGDKKYLFQVLQSNEARLQIEAVASGTGGAMKNISQVQIMNLTIPLPDIEIQNELAEKAQHLEQFLTQTRSHVQQSIEFKRILLTNLLYFQG